jgi:hypothetical protein
MRGLTGILTYWGQFIAHDIDLTGGPAGSAMPLQPITIEIPKGDPFFDPTNTGTQKMTINRSVYDPTTGNSTANPRQQMTLVSSFLDGSMVYGSDNATATAIRNSTGGLGLLKVSLKDGLELPPLNTFGISMENNAVHYNASDLYLLGDVRGNENPALTALHTLFIREHNRKARELHTANPTWTDEELYQEARRWVIAVIQHITFDEYLPVTIGDAQNPYEGYNSSVNPAMYTEFSTGAFRYGHSEVEEWVWRLNSTGGEIPEGHLHLRDSYYNSPHTIGQVGIEPLIRGMAGKPQNAVDVWFVDDLRNFLFGAPGSGGFDLAAINIQRGRDHGIPGFNELRSLYGLEPYTKWEEINPDPAVWKLLQAAYKSIDDCDIYVCGLAEFHDIANVGETFGTVINDQYHRFRDGDRFWYENKQFTDAELAEIKGSTLRDVILRNTRIQADELQCFVFAGPDGCGKAITAPAAGPLYSKYDFVVKLQKKTPAHPYYGKGHAYAFTINGQEGPNLNLERGKVYYLQIQASCAHAFVFVPTPDIDGVVLGPVVTPGGEGGEEEEEEMAGVLHNLGCIDFNREMAIVVRNDAPDFFYYQCDFHDMLMGGNVIVAGQGDVSDSTLLQPVLMAFFAALALLF